MRLLNEPSRLDSRRDESSRSQFSLCSLFRAECSAALFYSVLFRSVLSASSSRALSERERARLVARASIAVAVEERVEV